MSDWLEEFKRDVDAIAEEWDVSELARYTVLGLQVMAMEAGCATADDGLAWAVERGYCERTDEPVSGSRGYRVTDTGIQAVVAYARGDAA